MPEPEQHRLCQAALDLDMYTDDCYSTRYGLSANPGTIACYSRHGERPLTAAAANNKRADSKAFKAIIEMKRNESTLEKMKQVYRVLGVTNASNMPITPEEHRQYYSNLKRRIIILLAISAIFFGCDYLVEYNTLPINRAILVSANLQNER